jgi:hypothetical protein
MRTFGRKTIALVVGAVAALTIAGAAFAAITGPDANGNGFVGKGDVQAVYAALGINTNNAWLQGVSASVDFRIQSETETTWTCSRTNPAGNEVVVNRHNSTSLRGLLTTVARLKNQITGFNLTGFDGPAVVEEDGQPLESCPPASGDPFTYDNNAVTTELGGGLEVTINGTNWYPIP